MGTMSSWFGALLPVILVLGFCVWLVAHYNKRVTETDEPSETDELE